MTSVTAPNIRNVAIAGGTGLLGSLVIKCLVEAGQYKVTILSRTDRGIAQHDGAELAVVDYDDRSSLIKALKGQDAVICTLSREATLLQLPLIDAAVDSGVKRFIPSEFGGNLQHPNSRVLPNYKNKVLVEEYLEKKSKSNGISYTYIYNNVFMDWSIEVGILLNLKDGQAHLYDGGERAVSMIRVPTVARAIVSVLGHFEETENRAVCIHEALITQKQLLRYAKDVAPERKWRVEHVDLDELERKARAREQPGVPNMSLFHAFAVRGGFGKGYGNQFGESDNQLLGIEAMSADEIKNMLRK